MKRIYLTLLTLLITLALVHAQDQPSQVKYPTAQDSAASLVEVADNAKTTLKFSLAANATTMTVASTAKFPATGFLVIDGREIVSYTGKTSNSFTGLLRGQQGSAALVHAAGVTVEMRLLAVDHNALSLAIRNLESKLGTGNSTPSLNMLPFGNGAGSSAWRARSSGDITTALGFSPAAGVSSVGLALPNLFNVSGTPISGSGGSGTLTGTLANQNANLVFAGPASGSTAAPTFRVLGAGDLPATVAYTNANNTFTGANVFQGIGVSGTTPTARRPFNLQASGINQGTLGGDYIGATIIVSGGGGTSGEHMAGLGINVTASQNMPNTGSPIGANIQTTVAAGVTSDQQNGINMSNFVLGTANTMYSYFNQVAALNGGSTTFNTYANFNDIVSVGTSNLTNPNLFHGQLRSVSGGQFSGTAKGIDLSGWGGAPPVSYAIYIDTSVDIGASPHAIWSLSASPSLLGGELTVSGLLKLGTTPVTINNSAGKILGVALVGTDITTLGTITTGVWNGTVIGYGYGGTGLTSTPGNGQLPIGNGSGYTLATLNAGQGVAITNGGGSITVGTTGEVLLASVASVNLKPAHTGDKQDLYTIPAGKHLIVTRWVIVSPTADVNDGQYHIGFTASADDLTTGFGGVNGPLAGRTIIIPFDSYATGTSFVVGNPGEVLGLTASSLPGNSATATVLVYGQLY